MCVCVLHVGVRVFVITFCVPVALLDIHPVACVFTTFGHSEIVSFLSILEIKYIFINIFI